MCVCEHVTFYVAVRLFGVKTMGDRRVLTAAGWLHLNQFFPPTHVSSSPFFRSTGLHLCLLPDGWHDPLHASAHSINASPYHVYPCTDEEN